MIPQRKFSFAPFIDLILIFVIGCVTYLPGLSQAGIYRDDWYYTMDRLIGGPGIFQQMFSIDRPARGPLFEGYFQLFGVNPFPYHMSSFLWRILGGFTALWLFRLLWPGKRSPAIVMAILFVLYPGYLRWMEGFENQPRILSSFLEVLSIALTVQAIRTSRKTPKALAWAASILTGWAYIAFVDFSIGMEVFRLLCVFLVVQQAEPGRSFIRKSVSTFRTWAVAAVIPFGFLFWRLFIFQNERPATDVGLQLGSILGSPVSTGLWWLVRIFQSVINVSVLAWGAPLFQNLFGLRLISIIVGVLLAGLVVLLLLSVNLFIDKVEDKQVEELVNGQGGWQMEAIVMGLVGVVFGVAPVVLANRYVAFGNYSHYALPASLAGALLATGLVYSIKSRQIQLGLMSVLVLLAVLTHYMVASQILAEEKVINNFWQQVAWRIPNINSGTTLMVNYPFIDYAEDVDAVAGPANYLYFPGQTNQIPAVYELVALPQMEYTTKDIVAGGDKPYGYRTHIGTINYAKLLVMSQPTESSCVHVVDAQWPRYTDQDSDQILLIGKYSRIENIQTEGITPRPDVRIFGPEPVHGWCFYYQKAELALQKQDWAQILKLGDEVNHQNMHPVDRLEWAPFLQAYAVQGDEQAFKSVAVKIDSSPFVRIQACNTMTKMQNLGYVFTPQIQTLMEEKLCRGQ
ncbi:MAG: hypothetical protein WCK35_12205 [Chloroflexota bacterium]